ncbi:hypothetical protein KSF_007910 [Reticulibacter mediterranei]|uniref:Uncharacterized protein n=1 Tax=Reticulibacter mediterranei TaxID=2778369 RepID=A0A8J3MZR9_9CHLR|nr:hypothetical protein [Reticulibacter mediterranei]GHO90743.1 hypothetical protein KSF_007910 [Reticulibacter mediterranei]
MDRVKPMTLQEATTTQPERPQEQARLLSYNPPEVTVLGKVEQLTGALRHGTPDLLGHGNIL